jgi:hypothetical protein
MSAKCFMIQPFDAGKFDKRFDDVFAPAVKAAGLDAYRVDRDPGVAVPIDNIERGIRESAACFVDVTVDNPNVWFELGFAIAAKKDLCLVCSKERTGSFPFDIQHRRIITYSPDSPRDFVALGEAITSRLIAILQQQEARADIQSIAKDSVTSGLTDYEAVALASIASVAGGVDDAVSNWTLREEMEKAGYNRLACNVAVRGLRAKGHVNAVMLPSDNFSDGPYEAYTIADAGWDWISVNIHTLNLKSQKKNAKRSGFDKALDEEIPF